MDFFDKARTKKKRSINYFTNQNARVESLLTPTWVCHQGARVVCHEKTRNSNADVLIHPTNKQTTKTNSTIKIEHTILRNSGILSNSAIHSGDDLFYFVHGRWLSQRGVVDLICGNFQNWRRTKLRAAAFKLRTAFERPPNSFLRVMDGEKRRGF